MKTLIRTTINLIVFILLGILCCQAIHAQEEDISVFDMAREVSPSIEQELHSSDLFKESNSVLSPKNAGDFFNTLVLKIINKKVGKLQTIEVRVGKPIIFDNEILIRVPACWMEKIKKYNPETLALVEFYSISQMNLPEKKFQGWLFSRNPALNYFPHEKYEFIVQGCKNTTP
jgi:hypothetical protein